MVTGSCYPGPDLRDHTANKKMSRRIAVPQLNYHYLLSGRNPASLSFYLFHIPRKTRRVILRPSIIHGSASYDQYNKLNITLFIKLERVLV